MVRALTGSGFKSAKGVFADVISPATALQICGGFFSLTDARKTIVHRTAGNCARLAVGDELSRSRELVQVVYFSPSVEQLCRADSSSAPRSAPSRRPPSPARQTGHGPAALA